MIDSLDHKTSDYDTHTSRYNRHDNHHKNNTQLRVHMEKRRITSHQIQIISRETETTPHVFRCRLIISQSSSFNHCSLVQMFYMTIVRCAVVMQMLGCSLKLKSLKRKSHSKTDFSLQNVQVTLVIMCMTRREGEREKGKRRQDEENAPWDRQVFSCYIEIYLMICFQYDDQQDQTSSASVNEQFVWRAAHQRLDVMFPSGCKRGKGESGAKKGIQDKKERENDFYGIKYPLFWSIKWLKSWMYQKVKSSSTHQLVNSGSQYLLLLLPPHLSLSFCRFSLSSPLLSSLFLLIPKGTENSAPFSSILASFDIINNYCYLR